MKKLIFILFSFLSVLSFSQTYDRDQVIEVWEGRVMPSRVNLQNTWDALWFKTDTLPGGGISSITDSTFIPFAISSDSLANSYLRQIVDTIFLDSAKFIGGLGSDVHLDFGSPSFPYWELSMDAPTYNLSYIYGDASQLYINSTYGEGFLYIQGLNTTIQTTTLTVNADTATFNSTDYFQVSTDGNNFLESFLRASDTQLDFGYSTNNTLEFTTDNSYLLTPRFEVSTPNLTLNLGTGDVGSVLTNQGSGVSEWEPPTGVVKSVTSSTIAASPSDPIYSNSITATTMFKNGDVAKYESLIEYTGNGLGDDSLILNINSDRIALPASSTPIPTYFKLDITFIRVSNTSLRYAVFFSPYYWDGVSFAEMYSTTGLLSVNLTTTNVGINTAANSNASWNGYYAFINYFKNQ